MFKGHGIKEGDMGASGLLDVERRVESACVESLKTWTDLTALLENGADGIVSRRDCDEQAGFPSLYVEAYNLAEYGAHTGNYMGGLRLGGMTYIDDDVNQDTVKRVMGAARSWINRKDATGKEGIVTILNNTTSAQTAGNEVYFFAVELDMFGDGGSQAYIVQSTRVNRAHEGIIEATIVCMPSRPN